MSTPTQPNTPAAEHAAHATPPVAFAPPVAFGALSPLAQPFEPSNDWPELGQPRATPKTREQGRARSLRV